MRGKCEGSTTRGLRSSTGQSLLDVLDVLDDEVLVAVAVAVLPADEPSDDVVDVLLESPVVDDEVVDELFDEPPRLSVL